MLVPRNTTDARLASAADWPHRPMKYSARKVLSP